jgi:hypothetical protein
MATRLRPAVALLAGVSTLVDWISIQLALSMGQSSVSLRFVFHLHH